MNKLSLVVIIPLLCSCSATEATYINITTDSLTASNSASTNTSFTKEEIAKFAIATIMNKSPAIINAETKENIKISYTRKSDNQKFEYKIKFDGYKIVWANANGRWRDTEKDEKLSFEKSGDQINILQIFADGSVSKTTFTKKDL